MYLHQYPADLGYSLPVSHNAQSGTVLAQWPAIHKKTICQNNNNNITNDQKMIRKHYKQFKAVVPTGYSQDAAQRLHWPRYCVCVPTPQTGDKSTASGTRWNLFEVFCTEKPQSFKEPKPRGNIHNKYLSPSSSSPSARPAVCIPAAAVWGQYTPPGCRHPSCCSQRFAGCDGGRRLDAAGGVCCVAGGRLPPCG